MFRAVLASERMFYIVQWNFRRATHAQQSKLYYVVMCLQVQKLTVSSEKINWDYLEEEPSLLKKLLNDKWNMETPNWLPLHLNVHRDRRWDNQNTFHFLNTIRREGWQIMFWSLVYSNIYFQVMLSTGNENSQIRQMYLHSAPRPSHENCPAVMEPCLGTHCQYTCKTVSKSSWKFVRCLSTQQLRWCIREPPVICSPNAGRNVQHGLLSE